MFIVFFADLFSDVFAFDLVTQFYREGIHGTFQQLYAAYYFQSQGPFSIGVLSGGRNDGSTIF